MISVIRFVRLGLAASIGLGCLTIMVGTLLTVITPDVFMRLMTRTFLAAGIFCGIYLVEMALMKISGGES